MKIIIGSDHAGFQLKEYLRESLIENNIKIIDAGTFTEERADYPDYAHKVAKQVNDGIIPFGILICGSGEGVCMAANKHPKVRAALVWNKDVAILSRQHNNANIICLPARFIAREYAKEIIEVFIETKFEGGRHQNRIDKI